MYGHYFPDDRVDGVEIDGELTEIGVATSTSRAPTSTLHGRRPPLAAASDGDYDVIVVDAYRQPYIPFYLATEGVLRARRARSWRRAGW